MRWPKTFIACLTSGALGAALLVLTRSAGDPHAVRPFESSAWRQGSISERGTMARDLESSNRLLGLEATEVVVLLGEPDQKHGFSSFDYTIDLGYRFVSSPWTYSLHLGFGNDGKVARVELRD